MTSYQLLPAAVADLVREHLQGDVLEEFNASLRDTPALPAGDLNVDTPAPEFAAAFLIPLEDLARRCNLFFFAAVAEPGEQAQRLTVNKAARVRHYPPVDGAYTAWKNNLAQLARDL